MLKYLLFSIATVSILGGCSSTQTIANVQEPYCYTNETVTENNGSINSTTSVQCSDNPLKRAKLVGVDPKSCRTWRRTEPVNGHNKTYGGYICRDAKGNWRPLTDY